MSRVLVTGAGGFIGRHTLPGLTAAGHEVHAVTSSKPGGRAAGQSPVQVRWHCADLLEPGAAWALTEAAQPTHLLHLAWFLAPPAHLTAEVNCDWVHAGMQLLRAFGATGGRRAVLAGTYAEYASAPEVHCVEEQTPILPDSLYGAAKHGLHVIAAAWAQQNGVQICWGRIFNVYGPHEHATSLVGTVTRALLRGTEAATSHGRQVRDYLYVEDAGRALVALLGSEATGAVNVASGAPVQLADVIAAIAAQTGRPELVRRGALPQRPGESERLTADVRRLHEEVCWSPSVDLREGVRRTVEWWRRALAAQPAGAAVRPEPAG
jgi:nucleoside-diphosphate-sugar epimerase